MKIKIEVEIPYDQKNRESCRVEQGHCRFFQGQTYPDTYCLLFDDDLFEDERCDDCKEAYQKACKK